MKKLLSILLPLCLIVATFSSCGKEESAVDKIVGTYFAERTGSVTMIMNGQNFSMPIDGEGAATITKLSNNRIRLSYGSDKFDGIVADDHISFESYTITQTEQTEVGVMTMTLTISPTGNIAGQTITIREKYSGSCFIQGSSFPITGQGSVVLRKN